MRSSSTQAPPLSSRAPSGRIHRYWWKLARGAWAICALLMLANFVASIPANYQIMNTICSLPTQGDCNGEFGQLTADSVQALTHLHLSLTGYVIYFVTLNVVLSLLPWGIGLLLFWRKPDDGMALFVSLLFILWAGNGNSNTLSGLWAGAHPSPLIALLLNVISGVQWIGIGVFLLTFPTGRFMPRWSAFMVAFWVFTFVSPPLPAPLSDILYPLTTLILLGGTLFALIYRYRRVFDAPQRQQTKWVIYAAAAWAITAVIGNVLPVVLPAQSPFQLLFPTVVIFFPSIFLYLGISFAILRYRLWDIDTIINRTLVYGTLTAILTLSYVGLILALQALAHALTGQRGDQPLVIVGSTLVIIAFFNPLRRRIQTFIDRRFYRRKYDAAKILAAFTTSLRTEVDLTELRERLVNVVEETMQPTQISLWLRPPERQEEEPAHRLEPSMVTSAGREPG